MKHFLTLICAALLVGGCSGEDPVDNEAKVTGLPDPNRQGGDPASGTAQTPVGAAQPAGNQPAARPGTIPAPLHGRWGMTPQDCTSTRGDAKGLLVITADELRFYESRAVPTANVTTAADSISGDFNFTGEGQNWTKFQGLERRPTGLVRAERDPNASFSYVRCD